MKDVENLMPQTLVLEALSEQWHFPSYSEFVDEDDVYNDNHRNVFIFPIFLNVRNEWQHLSRSFKEYKQSSHFVLRLKRLQVSVNNRGRSPVQEVDPLTHLTSAQERLELCIILYNMRKYGQNGTHLSQCQQWHEKVFAQVIHTWSQCMHWHCWYCCCCCCCCCVLFIQYQCQRPPKLSNIAGAELAHGKYLQLCIAPVSCELYSLKMLIPISCYMHKVTHGDVCLESHLGLCGQSQWSPCLWTSKT